MQAFEPFSPISCAPKIPYSSSATPATNRVPFRAAPKPWSTSGARAPRQAARDRAIPPQGRELAVVIEKLTARTMGCSEAIGLQ
jgi:hypothetical protein